MLPTQLKPAFRIQHVSLRDGGVGVRWDDEHNSFYPDLWLRDACRCPTCFNATTLMPQSGHNISTLTLDPTIVSAQTDERGNLIVRWDPSEHGEPSEFDSSWLRANCSRLAVGETAPNQWGADVVMAEYEGAEILEDDDVLLAWLNSLKDDGIAMVHGVPTTHEGLTSVMKRVGMLRTRYHPVNVYSFDTTNTTAMAANNAYSFARLDPHTDFTPYPDSGVISALLCLRYENPAGDRKGYSTVVDGFKIAEVIRCERPDYYRLLTEVPVSFCRRRLETHEPMGQHHRKTDYQYESCIQRHIIQLNDRGVPCQVVHHNNNRSTLPAARADLREFSAAYKYFVTLLESREYEVEFLIEPGQMFTYNNARVLHGRSELSEGIQRVLIGTAVQEATWRSRWRILTGQKSGLSDLWLRGCSDESLKFLAEHLR